MDTEVYVFCPECKRIVDGIGSGDLRDMITCSECNSHLTANAIGLFKPYEGDRKEKRLYFPEHY